MNTRINIWFLALTLTMLFGCRSPEEQATTTALSFAQSAEIYNAPFRAYALLCADDKAFMSAEAFAAAAPAEPRAPKALLSVVSAKVELGQALVEIDLSDPLGETSRLKYVLSKEGDKWRIRLDLERLQALRDAIVAIRAHVEAGDLESARAKLVDSRAKPFRASNANDLLEEFGDVEAELEEAERLARLVRDLEDAKLYKGADLESAIKSLGQRITPKDQVAEPLLRGLESQLRAEQKHTMLSQLPIPTGRVRRVQRGLGLVREATIQYRNPLKVALTAATIEVSFLDEPNGEALEVRSVALPFKSELAAGASREFTFSLEPSPPSWNGRLISLQHNDISPVFE